MPYRPLCASVRRARCAKRQAGRRDATRRRRRDARRGGPGGGGAAAMTHGVGMVLDSGLVLAADTRTNAGVDNIATFKKLHVWERQGERVIMLVTAGNLAVTQAVVALLGEEAQGNRRKDARPN